MSAYSNKISPQIQLALRYSNILPYDAFLSIIGQPIGADKWEVLVACYGSLALVEQHMAIEIKRINEFFAICKVRSDQIELLASFNNIVYIEFPEVMEYCVQESMVQICAQAATSSSGEYGLTGKGILIAVIDSGIDYFHSDFIDLDGKTRINYLWDQNVPDETVDSFDTGTIYTASQINEALAAPTREEGLEIVPSVDRLGHGTAMAGVAAGNGRASNGRNRGVAIESTLLVVKLLEREGAGENVYLGPRNIDVMQGVRFAVEKASELGMPVVVYTGVGINEGGHDGDSSLELYLQMAANFYVCNIIVPTGNQGNKDSHYEGVVGQDQEDSVQIFIDNNQPYYFCTLWKSFFDEFDIVIESPGGQQTEVLQGVINNRAFIFGNTLVMVNFSEPSRASTDQQIIIFLERFNSDSINAGIWRIVVGGQKIVDGRFNIWGSSIDPVKRYAYFLQSSPYITLTIPATGRLVTSVGAYNGLTNQIANFSGRGFTRDHRIKPDIVAPGVDVLAPLAGGSNGYSTVSGTSVAAAFAAGGYALLMEYGILEKKDASLYGERLKAYVTKNTKKPLNYGPYPNQQWGYGQLCIEQVLAELRRKYNVT